MVLGTGYDVFVIHQLHLDSGDSLDKKPGGILANEPGENESRDIRYRVGASEQSPLLGGTSERNIQDQQQPGIGNAWCSQMFCLAYFYSIACFENESYINKALDIST